jgi:hypothetical protein
LVPIAARLERLVRAYGIAVVIAAAVIVATVLIVDLPETVWTWGLAIVFVGALLFAPVVILLFASMLREALTLPAQFRSLPDIAPARARELAAVAREAKDWRQHERAGSIPRDSWRAATLLNALRKAVPSVSVVLSLARVPFMILVGIALLVGFVELVLAPVVVVVALLAAAI